MKIFRFVALLISITFSLQAKDIESVFAKKEGTVEFQEAKRLSALGSIQHQKGNYKSALQYYARSIHLREKNGMDLTNSFANILFLSSIAHHRMGNSCISSQEVKRAIAIYRGNHQDEQLALAEKELEKTYSPACGKNLFTKK